MVDSAQTSCIGYRKSSHGCISFARNFTRIAFTALLDEVFARFPHIDGLVVRYGENSPGPFDVGNAPWDPEHPFTSIAAFIDTLREELSVRRNRTVVFRTWDTNTSSFHANATYYHEVTGRIEPHPRLVFSIKHTALDFWRRTNWNPCIGIGRHQQVIEMCIGNVFGGMGAYPSYVPSGVLHGFPEVAPLYGLADAVRDFPEVVVGVFPVTQGSFTFEYTSSRPQCEDCYSGRVPPPFVWPALEFQVLAAWGNEPWRTEADVFQRVVRREWGLAAEDAAIFRKALLLAMDANLRVETVGVFDHAVTRGVIRPSAQFVNRNSLAGLAGMGQDGACNAGPGVPGSGVENACDVLPWLHNHSQEEAAIAEKQLATSLYAQVGTLFHSLGSLPVAIQQHVDVTTQYGELLATMVYHGFVTLLEATKPQPNVTRLCTAADLYNATKQRYTDLWESHPGLCPTLFTDETWWYGAKPPGLGADVRHFQRMLCSALPQQLMQPRLRSPGHR